VAKPLRLDARRAPDEAMPSGLSTALGRHFSVNEFVGQIGLTLDNSRSTAS
jgi:hypothetical protein